MSYYFNTVIKNKTFDEVIGMVTDELKKESFGVLSVIDVQQTFKNKLNVDFRKYKILGACNPQLAHKALQQEDKLGLLLPCNILIEEHENGEIEVSAIDAVAQLSPAKNKALDGIAAEVKQKLINVINSLK